MVSGKEFRASLKKPLPGAKKPKECRLVPPFTIQALQKDTCVIPPPKLDPFKPVEVSSYKFREYYKGGSLPIAMEAKGGRVVWKADINKLDYHYYLPMFFEGLVETEKPYVLFVQQGIESLLAAGGQKVFPVIPQLIIPLKEALRTKNKTIMMGALSVIQKLVKCHDMIGEALVPYYRQLLPTLNMFKDKNVNCGELIDYSQVRGDNLADAINDTLECLERHGGEDAFINIKYLIPTYESCMMN